MYIAMSLKEKLLYVQYSRALSCYSIQFYKLKGGRQRMWHKNTKGKIIIKSQ